MLDWGPFINFMPLLSKPKEILHTVPSTAFSEEKQVVNIKMYNYRCNISSIGLSICSQASCSQMLFPNTLPLHALEDCVEAMGEIFSEEDFILRLFIYFLSIRHQISCYDWAYLGVFTVAISYLLERNAIYF